jgi:hypothetical protein
MELNTELAPKLVASPNCAVMVAPPAPTVTVNGLPDATANPVAVLNPPAPPPPP